MLLKSYSGMWHRVTGWLVPDVLRGRSVSVFKGRKVQPFSKRLEPIIQGRGTTAHKNGDLKSKFFLIILPLFMYVNSNLLLQAVHILNTRYLHFKGENA